MFFLSWGFFPQNVHFWGCGIFYSFVIMQSTQFFQWHIFSRIYKIHVFDETIFFFKYQNAYDHQTVQDGDILRRPLTNKNVWHLNGVALWGHVTSKIYSSTWRRCMDTELGKVITFSSMRKNKAVNEIML